MDKGNYLAEFSFDYSNIYRSKKDYTAGLFGAGMLVKAKEDSGEVFISWDKVLVAMANAGYFNVL